MKKDIPSRLAPSKATSSKRAPSRLAPSNQDPPRRLPVVALVLILAAILAAVGGTVAIYTSQAFQRSVVRNRDTEAIRFSSDNLYRVAPGTAPQKYYYPMAQGAKTMTFQVCNYDQSKNTVFNEKNIEYTITFQVNNGTEDFPYTVSSGTETQTVTTGNSTEFRHSLRGGKRSVNNYSFTFADGDYNKIELEVTVTPTDLAVTKNMTLNGILIPIEYATTQGVTMKSEYPDSHRTTPDQVDAYNLSVSISGGKGNVVITWDEEALDIDPFFLARSNVKGTGSPITVEMNAEDATGVYLIQFYNKKSTKPEWTEWKDLPITVILEQ